MTRQLSVEEVLRRISRDRPVAFPPGWHTWASAIEAHRYLAAQFLESLPDHEGAIGGGRGVVVCGGGARLFANAWVCLRSLRERGCTLPVELWHLGSPEMDEAMRRCAGELGANCVDAEIVRRERGARILRGFELKAFALLHCAFEEVILLDADNVPLIDMSAVFTWPEYQSSGAVFWPDYGRLSPDRVIWEACDVTFRDEPEFESGQIAVDKRRCWKALALAKWYNDHSDFFYHHIHGDKDTFHMAFRRTETPYSMVPHAIRPLEATMCQHDFHGTIILQHRNMDKWRLDGNNRRIPGFQREEECLRFLAELRERWSGEVTPARSAPDGAGPQLSGRRFIYHRVGHDARVIEFSPDGRIGEGSQRCERGWVVRREGEHAVCAIQGDYGETCRVWRVNDDFWVGQWSIAERMPVELVSLETKRGSSLGRHLPGAGLEAHECTVNLFLRRADSVAIAQSIEEELPSWLQERHPKREPTANVDLLIVLAGEAPGRIGALLGDWRGARPTTILVWGSNSKYLTDGVEFRHVLDAIQALSEDGYRVEGEWFEADGLIALTRT